MDVHPTKHGINRYWSIPICIYQLYRWSNICTPKNWMVNTKCNICGRCLGAWNCHNSSTICRWDPMNLNNFKHIKTIQTVIIRKVWQWKLSDNWSEPFPCGYSTEAMELAEIISSEKPRASIGVPSDQSKSHPLSWWGQVKRWTRSWSAGRTSATSQRCPGSAEDSAWGRPGRQEGTQDRRPW